MCLLEADNAWLVFVKNFIYIIYILHEAPTIPLNYVFYCHYSYRFLPWCVWVVCVILCNWIRFGTSNSGKRLFFHSEIHVLVWPTGGQRIGVPWTPTTRRALRGVLRGAAIVAVDAWLAVSVPSAPSEVVPGAELAWPKRAAPLPTVLHVATASACYTVCAATAGAARGSPEGGWCGTQSASQYCVAADTRRRSTPPVARRKHCISFPWFWEWNISRNFHLMIFFLLWIFCLT